MDAPRCHFLSGSAFSDDEHGTIHFCHLAESALEVEEGGGFSNGVGKGCCG